MNVNDNPLFRVHRLNETGVARAQAIANGFTLLQAQLETMYPAGRELSVVKTKLEEACFFAKKAMSNDVTNQTTEEERAR